MSFYCKIDEFHEDLKDSNAFLELVIKTGDSLRTYIAYSLKRENVKTADILLVGSTNPQRLTAVIDPKAPDDRYPSDFDVGIVVSETFDKSEKENLLKKIFPQAIVSDKCGRLEARFYKDKFPVDASLLDEKEAENCLPLKYTLNFAKFDQDQIYNIRFLKLFTMRNGLYGGYTRGFKGITLEQLVVKYGSVDNVMSWLQNQKNNFESGNRPSLLDPIRKLNLLEYLHYDIWKRLFKAVNSYKLHGHLRAVPYTIEGWQRDHPNSHVFGLQSSDSDPFKLYKEVALMINETINENSPPLNVQYCHLVIPHYKSNQVLVSVSELNSYQMATFRRKLISKWDKKKNGC